MNQTGSDSPIGADGHPLPIELGKLKGISVLIAFGVNDMPRDYQIAIRDTIDELLWQLYNPGMLWIKENRYDQLAQEAALTIAQAVKIKRAVNTAPKISGFDKDRDAKLNDNNDM
jgi:hypothetical protein